VRKKTKPLSDEETRIARLERLADTMIETAEHAGDPEIQSTTARSALMVVGELRRPRRRRETRRRDDDRTSARVGSSPPRSRARPVRPLRREPQRGCREVGVGVIHLQKYMHDVTTECTETWCGSGMRGAVEDPADSDCMPCLVPPRHSGASAPHASRPCARKDWNACPYQAHADDCDCGGRRR